MDARNLNEIYKDVINSPEYKKYFKGIKERKDLTQLRYKKFEEWLKNNDFDFLLQKIISKHDDKYETKCREKGIESHPNNVLTFIFDYLIDNKKPVDVKELDCDFSNYILEFENYYFQVIMGQGSIHRIYSKKPIKLFLQI